MGSGGKKNVWFRVALAAAAALGLAQDIGKIPNREPLDSVNTAVAVQIYDSDPLDPTRDAGIIMSDWIKKTVDSDVAIERIANIPFDSTDLSWMPVRQQVQLYRHGVIDSETAVKRVHSVVIGEHVEDALAIVKKYRNGLKVLSLLANAGSDEEQKDTFKGRAEEDEASGYSGVLLPGPCTCCGGRGFFIKGEELTIEGTFELELDRINLNKVTCPCCNGSGRQ